MDFSKRSVPTSPPSRHFWMYCWLAAMGFAVVGFSFPPVTSRSFNSQLDDIGRAEQFPRDAETGHRAGSNRSRCIGNTIQAAASS
jgi:hypothetical protein